MLSTESYENTGIAMSMPEFQNVQSTHMDLVSRMQNSQACGKSAQDTTLTNTISGQPSGHSTQTQQLHTKRSLTMREKGCQLWYAAKLTDIAVHLDNEENVYQAHKFVLYTQSPYFERAFAQHPRINEVRKIRLENVASPGFAALLTFFYTKTLPGITYRNIGDVIDTAEKLECDAALRVCEDFLTKNLNPDTVLLTVQATMSTDSMALLRNTCIELVSDHFYDVTRTRAFLEMPPETMQVVFSCSCLLKPSEFDRYEAIVKWGRHKLSERKPTMDALLQSAIVYGNMSIRDLRLVSAYTPHLKTDAQFAEFRDACIRLICEGSNEPRQQQGLDTFSAPECGLEPAPMAMYMNPQNFKTGLHLQHHSQPCFIQRDNVVGDFSCLQHPNESKANKSAAVQQNIEELIATDMSLNLLPNKYARDAGLSAGAQGDHGKMLNNLAARGSQELTHTLKNTSKKELVRNYSRRASPPSPQIALIGGIDITEMGQSEYNFMIYSPPKVWKKGPRLPARLHMHAVCYLSGKVYVSGGIRLDENSPRPKSKRASAAAATNRFLSYTIRTQHWKFRSRMKISREDHAMLAYRGCIYVIGGIDEHGDVLDKVEQYDPTTNQWSDCQPIMIGRSGLAACVQNDSIIIAGGIGSKRDANDSSQPLTVLNSVECYSKATCTWIEKQCLPQPVCYSSMVAVNTDEIYMIGGATTSPEGPIILRSISDITAYSCHRNWWTTVGKLANERHRHTVQAINSDIYVFGGFSTAQDAVLTSVEVINAVTGQVSQSMMPIPGIRAGYQACQLMAG